MHSRTVWETSVFKWRQEVGAREISGGVGVTGLGGQDRRRLGVSGHVLRVAGRNMSVTPTEGLLSSGTLQISASGLV